MKMNATEFKATCLAVIDRVRSSRQPVSITKHGRVVAKLVPDTGDTEQPWLRLRGKPVRWVGDPFAPVVTDEDLSAAK